jgi:hypothetical protein
MEGIAKARPRRHGDGEGLRHWPGERLFWKPLHWMVGRNLACIRRGGVALAPTLRDYVWENTVRIG